MSNAEHKDKKKFLLYNLQFNHFPLSQRKTAEFDHWTSITVITDRALTQGQFWNLQYTTEAFLKTDELQLRHITYVTENIEQWNINKQAPPKHMVINCKTVQGTRISGSHLNSFKFS